MTHISIILSEFQPLRNSLNETKSNVTLHTLNGVYRVQCHVVSLPWQPYHRVYNRKRIKVNWTWYSLIKDDPTCFSLKYKVMIQSLGISASSSCSSLEPWSCSLQLHALSNVSTASNEANLADEDTWHAIKWNCRLTVNQGFLHRARNMFSTSLFRLSVLIDSTNFA